MAVENRLLAVVPRTEELDDLFAYVGVRQSGVRLHLVGRHDLVRVLDEFVERGFVPRDTRILHAVRVAGVLSRASLGAKNAVQRWSLPVIARFERVTGAAMIVERQLALAGRRLISRAGRECGQDERTGSDLS
jgi:hypothetical protein